MPMTTNDVHGLRREALLSLPRHRLVDALEATIAATEAASQASLAASIAARDSGDHTAADAYHREYLQHAFTLAALLGVAGDALDPAPAQTIERTP